MRWSDRCVLVTGATGGIGRELVSILTDRGAKLVVAGRNVDALRALAAQAPERIQTVAADIGITSERRRIVQAAEIARVDMIINAAGINHFGMFEEQHAEQIERMVMTNVTATLLVTQALLPRLLRHDAAWIVNVGSAFGAIGHPGYSVYCATKFALRGFSQALRRELTDTPVRVLHIAPRATRTEMNDANVDALNTALGNSVDAPREVANAIVRDIEKGTKDRQIGWPECLLVRLNGLLPGIVDRALKKRLQTIQRHARQPSITP
ncbi:SDR family oxidoreductase [Salinicola rhizosphaerae]|uniref:Short chain dehydrogenase n=1 Tax=Salinicola rhizosphaerae TaxID=1443141 RepID=A0ABQ3E1C6_9GAMM|nr:SDR family oxidoreductase [Salinicola rhizosphaerae]GHB21866.1 short chain dehydrogenase [Salinicola rhizosphaerae]